MGVAPIRFGAPGFPILRLAGLPLHCVHQASCDRSRGGRRRPARHTFLVTHTPLQGTSPRSHRRRVRAMPATAVEGRPRNVEPATLLSFLALQRFRNRGSADRGDRCPRHVPASAFPTPSPAYSPRDLSSIFQPVTLLGFGLQGFRSSRRAGDPLGPPLLSCRSPRVVWSFDRPPPGAAPEYSLRESVPCGARFYPHRPAVTLLAFFPFRALSLDAVVSGFPGTSSPALRRSDP